ncbi:carbohydrate kinase [Gluconobacter frateurii M-2]|nr:carbohydrate kinase [Gluconobacter frateurii M-2]
MGTAEVIVAQFPYPQITKHSYIDVEPGIKSEGKTILRVEELSRNFYWASKEDTVGKKLKEIISGASSVNSCFEQDYFIPGGQGGILPRFTIDAPKDAISRASAVVGALSRRGAASIATVAEYIGPKPEIYVAGGWARAPGWLELKQRVSSEKIHVVTETEVTAVGAGLLAATAIDWHLSAEDVLMPPVRPADSVCRFWNDTLH